MRIVYSSKACTPGHFSATSDFWHVVRVFGADTCGRRFLPMRHLGDDVSHSVPESWRPFRPSPRSAVQLQQTIMELRQQLAAQGAQIQRQEMIIQTLQAGVTG